jgi:hypothetical protein
VLTIIDTGQNPEAKALFLSGQINIAACPQCGYAGALSAPLVYHDPEKELLYTYMPTGLGLPEPEQQRIVGDLTNRVMSSLPAEARKGYLLRPRSFLTLEAMIEAILEADGITPEMIEAQRAKADLLTRLLQASGEEARRIIVEENDSQLDYEFFQLLSLNLELAQADGREEQTQQLLALRQQLLDWTKTGKEVAAREDAIRSLGTEVTREGLLEKLVEAALADDQVRVETMVGVARPAIDYIFYQQLTERIDAAEKGGKAEEEQKLRSLRETILALTAEIDAQMQKVTEEAASLLQEILDSQDPETVIRNNVHRMDDVFLGVLATSIEAAERSNRVEDLDKLEQIGHIFTELVLESQPPQVQLINRLLTVEYPDGTQALLEENRQHVDARLIEMMDAATEDLSQSGREEAAARMAQVREQAAALVGPA